MKREFGEAFPDDYARDDALIDELARGVDPSGGTDPLAAALLALKDDVDRPMPAPPAVVQEPATVASLDQARARRRPTSNPWVAGLVGAAAASTVILGTGAAVLSAENSSNETTMVELATTLDELEAANESGDEAAARELLEQARGLLANIKIRESRHGGAHATPAPRTVTATTTVSEVPEVTTRPHEQPSSPAPANPAPGTVASQQPSAQQPTPQPSAAQSSPVPSSAVQSSSRQSSPAPSATSPATAPQPSEQQPAPDQTAVEYGGNRVPSAAEGAPQQGAAGADMGSSASGML
ncbi:hypothetical protein [Corynebacterium lujinxingii]|uniref:Anti-sigma-D factor RsdA sigma factor binding region domain-containing protein n=1 Tax=Corynebacterium lujinxingii TaxID=2763010 RepID=A0A7H0JZX1_9CORY|nr:hypothetical protein [Corynebacterium lujinxingii]MBC3179015.1 hypothetical protein [Corynebacterium lujinxingii]NNO11375.1 hypothetical protein [Corynebacterium lujinxingii]QNP90587.1 hypothetical protein IAU68_01985 [Corynebacterium lujinxingii]